MLIVILQFVLSLSILVTLHELGHFFPAKWFGMRVEKFYLSFNPWFSLYKVKRGETEWGIGWLPLGGYVKIAGMIDESMDTEQMKQEPQEWEFRSKPAWQRLIVMLGGVTVNFVLGFFIFAMILWIYGEEYLPAKNAEHGIAVDNFGVEMGLQDGDHILSVGGQTFDKFNVGMIIKQVMLNDAREMRVMRNEEEITIQIPDSTAKKISKHSKKNGSFIAARVPMVIADVVKETSADSAGLEAGDSIISADGLPVHFYDEFVSIAGKNKKQEIDVVLRREGKENPIKLKVTPNDKGQIGAHVYGPDRFFDYEVQEYSFFAAFPAGISKGWNLLVVNVQALWRMITGQLSANENLGGFYSIAKLFPTTWHWQTFWYMTAVLSLILGFMNLLPIPALDGGHAMFLLIEMVMRRPVPQKVMEYAQVIGFVLLIALLLYANGLDILRWWRGE